LTAKKICLIKSISSPKCHVFQEEKRPISAAKKKEKATKS